MSHSLNQLEPYARGARVDFVLPDEVEDKGNTVAVFSWSTRLEPLVVGGTPRRGNEGNRDVSLT